MTSNNVLVLGWNAKGLRGYLRDASVTLDPDKYSHVLLQMPNGTGKTTTMALLRSALTGRLDQSLSIAALQADRTTKEGYFELVLSVYGERLTFRIDFDFEMGRHYLYTTTVQSGKQSGHLLNSIDPALASALSRSIDLFVFDGELAKDMLKDGAAAADKAIEALYRTDSFDDLVARIETLKGNRKKRNRDVTTASEQAVLIVIEN
ncbi:ATP-binding protein [Pseudorhodobacter wandonensis]|uniref:ATP-binding protein n=1 Tax=Pseudorhodobacter wandonensis TaxID=1120568 RepID=UPI000AB24AA2|nr:ATP-binding protein [Pseudorhodobacter wandonensis]